MAVCDSAEWLIQRTIQDSTHFAHASSERGFALAAQSSPSQFCIMGFKRSRHLCVQLQVLVLARTVPHLLCERTSSPETGWCLRWRFWKTSRLALIVRTTGHKLQPDTPSTSQVRGPVRRLWLRPQAQSTGQDHKLSPHDLHGQACIGSKTRRLLLSHFSEHLPFQVRTIPCALLSCRFSVTLYFCLTLASWRAAKLTIAPENRTATSETASFSPQLPRSYSRWYLGRGLSINGVCWMGGMVFASNLYCSTSPSRSHPFHPPTLPHPRV